MLIFDQLKKDDPQLRLLAIVVLGALGILLGGLWWVQVVSARDYQTNLQNQAFRTGRIPAVRGRILDRYGVRTMVIDNHRQRTMRGYLAESADWQMVYDEKLAQYSQMRQVVREPFGLVQAALRRGAQIVLEGAQGALLDNDWGTYPFCTASTTLAGGASAGLGIAPRWIESVSWPEARVLVGMTRQAVQDAPAYDAAEGLERGQEERTHEHYGRPGYWTTHGRRGDDAPHRPPPIAHITKNPGQSRGLPVSCRWLFSRWIEA